MPELPEVETVARELAAHGLTGRTLRRAVVRDKRLFPARSQRLGLGSLVGHACSNITRHGKFLILEFSNDWNLVLHLGMSGRILASQGPSSFHKHERLCLIFEQGLSLQFVDPRRFGKAWLVADTKEFLKKLGPDALRVSLRGFVERVQPRRRMIKPLLMDQQIIAGIGNIYADEALWRSKIHPRRRACTLSTCELHDLWHAMRTVLLRAIRHHGTSLGRGEGNFSTPSRESGAYGGFLKAYGRADQPCFRCGRPIVRTIIGQRSSYFCPRCQCSHFAKCEHRV